VGTAAGEGSVDLSACLAKLDEVGFNGWFSIEYEGEEDPFTAVPRSVENSRRLISPSSA
jgi:sugar phosphate isomerase/epimerase